MEKISNELSSAVKFLIRGIGVGAITLAASIQPVFAAPYAYLVNWSDANVSAVNLDIQLNTANISLTESSAYPWIWGYGYEQNTTPQLAVNRIGTQIYVVGKNKLSVISTKTNLVDKSYPLDDGSHALALSPDQNFLYVTNFQANAITVINLTTNELVKSIKLGSELFVYGGGGVTLDKQGKFLYVSSTGRDTSSSPAKSVSILKKVDLSNDSVTSLDLSTYTPNYYYGGGGGITIVEDKVFVSGMTFNQNTSPYWQHVVHQVDSNSFSLTKTIPLGINSWGYYGGGDIIADKEGKLFVTSQGLDANNVSTHRLSVIDSYGNVTSTTSLSNGDYWYGYHTGAMTLNEQDSEIYITEAFRVYKYSIKEQRVTDYFAAGAMPMGIVYISNVQPLSASDCPGKHAVYNPQNRTLSIPRMSVPLLDPVSGESTNKTGIFTGTLRLTEGVSDFKVDKFSFVEMENPNSSNACDAKYVFSDGKFSTGGSLYLPLVDVASVMMLPGNITVSGPVETYETSLRTLAVDATTLHLNKYYHVGTK